MALSAAVLKDLKDNIRNIPDLTTQMALFKLIEAISTNMGAVPIADGTINTATHPNLTTVNGIITAKAAA